MERRLRLAASTRLAGPLTIAPNSGGLPPNRHQKFYSLTRPGGAYQALLAPEDAAALPLLAEFQRTAAYARRPLPVGALTGRALYDYYDGLIEKYIGADRLFW